MSLNADDVDLLIAHMQNTEQLVCEILPAIGTTGKEQTICKVACCDLDD